MILTPLVEHPGHASQKVHGRRGSPNLPPDIANYSKAQLAALSDYQISGPSINAELRADSGELVGDQGWAGSIRLIDAAFMATPPTTQDAVVYRGEPGRWAAPAERLEYGYVSCSTERQTAKDFCEYARQDHQYGFEVVEVHIPKGTRVIMLDQLGSQNQAMQGGGKGNLKPGLFDLEDGEWTLPRGGTYTKLSDGVVRYDQPAEYDA